MPARWQAFFPFWSFLRAHQWMLMPVTSFVYWYVRKYFHFSKYSVSQKVTVRGLCSFNTGSLTSCDTAATWLSPLMHLCLSLSARGPASQAAVRHDLCGSLADGLGFLLSRVRSALCNPSYPFCLFSPPGSDSHFMDVSFSLNLGNKKVLKSLRLHLNGDLGRHCGFLLGI